MYDYQIQNSQLKYILEMNTTGSRDFYIRKIWSVSSLAKNKKQIRCTWNAAHNHEMWVKFFESSTINTYNQVQNLTFVCHFMKQIGDFHKGISQA